MATASQTVAQFMPPPVAVQHSDFAPPRVLYAAHIPAALVFTGIVAWAMGSEAGMVLASLVATVVSFYTFWDWLFRDAPTRFSTLQGAGLLFGYGTGALNTWLTLPRGSLTLASIMNMDEAVLARGLAAVLFSVAALYCVGELYEKPLFSRDFHFFINHRTQLLIYAGTLAMLAGFKSQALVMGGTFSSNGHISVTGAFLFWLYPPLTAIAVAAFLTSSRGWHRLFMGISALILLAMFTVTGRRSMFYTSLAIIFMLGIIGYRMRKSFFRKLAIVLALAGIVAVSALAFMLLRVAGATIRYHRNSVTLSRRVDAANKLVQQGGAFDLVSRVSRKNIQKRTFVLGFLSGVLEASSQQTPALGRDAINMARTVIPRVLDPGKDLSFGEEGLVDQTFGLTYGDEANSILTAGATDFGLLGMIAYPLLMVLLVRVLYSLFSRIFGVVPLMFITLALIMMMTQTEFTLSGYFAILRNTALFGAVIAVFMAFPRIRLRS
jgi:hypothetical protein